VVTLFLFLFSFALFAAPAISEEADYYDNDEWNTAGYGEALELYDAIYTWTGMLDLTAGAETAAKIVANNTISNVFVRLTNVITGVSNAAKEFTIHQRFEVSHDNENTVMGADHEIKSHPDKFTNVTWQEEFSPCRAAFFQMPTSNVQFSTVLKSNENLTAAVTYTVELLDVSISQGQGILVPNMKTQFFSYTPINDSNAQYDLMLNFLSFVNGTSVASAFDKILVGCGSDEANIDLSGVMASTYSFTVAGRKGSTVITLVAKDGATTPEFGFQVHQRPNTDKDDDGWKTWQIILIAVGGAVVVLAGLVAIGVAVVYLRRSHDYSRIN